jgi:hypothetical protein
MRSERHNYEAQGYRQLRKRPVKYLEPSAAESSPHPPCFPTNLEHNHNIGTPKLTQRNSTNIDPIQKAIEVIVSRELGGKVLFKKSPMALNAPL